jgi:hypothetical protein
MSRGVAVLVSVVVFLHSPLPVLVAMAAGVSFA